jgi:hypothetical protein
MTLSDLDFRKITPQTGEWLEGHRARVAAEEPIES